MSHDTTALAHKEVGSLHGRFFVPAYQRGYRWGQHEVRALLDDIWENGPRDYSLQPVVVMRRGDAEWDLVDGQQRLTTLYLVFRYIHGHLPKAPPAYTLWYATRPELEAFLRDEVHADELPEARWKANADFFHLRRAWEAVQAWFEGHGKDPTDVALEMRSRLVNHVRVIWYQAEDVDARALFSRLNIGRIALTSAELVKALLLARSDARAAERAAQWDAIERELREPAYWAFLTNAEAERHPARIELLLDLLAGRGNEWRRYQTFDTLRVQLDHDAAKLWERVLDLRARLREWFEDHDRFHQVGYLVATGGPQELAELVKAADEVGRRALGDALDARIRTRLKQRRTELVALSYDDKKTCQRVLLLANVATARRAREGRFPFHRHKGVRSEWTLEHVHAQQSEGLASDKEWQAWLDLHVGALASLPASEAREAMRARIAEERPQLTRERFRALAADVIALFSSGAEEGSDWVHSLANLALLPAAANTQLGNAVFAVKRRVVLELDRKGTYIPPCTRHVFLKYYTTDDTPQLQFWGAADRKAYEAALLDVLGPYLEDA
jgi:hypothetical protein